MKNRHQTLNVFFPHFIPPQLQDYKRGFSGENEYLISPNVCPPRYIIIFRWFLQNEDLVLIEAL